MTEVDTKDVFLRKIYEEAKKMQPTQRKGQSIFNATESSYSLIATQHNGKITKYD